MRRAGPLLGILLWLAAHAPTHADAQAAAQERVHVRREPGTMVAATVGFPSGVVHESPAEVGVTQLAAHALARTLAPALDALGARIDVACGRDATLLTLLAPPRTWRDAFGLLAGALRDPALDPASLARARAARAATARLDNGNPTWQVRVVTRQALFGPAHPRARPVCGLTETIEIVPADTVAVRARAAFRLDRAVAAVAGPVRADAATFIETHLGPHRFREPVRAPTPVRDSIRLAERNTVTAWVGMAFPFQGEADEAALRLLGFHIRQAVGPAPDRPGVLGAAAEVERHPGGGALYLYFMTRPEETLAWVVRIQGLVRAAASAGIRGAQFRGLVRRFRGERLLQLETPEARSGNAALLLVHDRAGDTLGGLDALGPEALRNAAERLGSPAVGLVGPGTLVASVSP